MIRPNRFLPAAVALACALAMGPNATVYAQAPAAPVPAPAPAPQGAYTAAQLETLVGPIALYADDLIAVVLPASTYPLQIVQADRFLEKRKSNSSLKIDDNWDDSVKTLANYPDIVKKMSADLAWTEALGTAVATARSMSTCRPVDRNGAAGSGCSLPTTSFVRRRASCMQLMSTLVSQVRSVD